MSDGQLAVERKKRKEDNKTEGEREQRDRYFVQLTAALVSCWDHEGHTSLKTNKQKKPQTKPENNQDRVD